MKPTVTKAIKITAGVCAALGIVAAGAVLASGAAVKVIAEGFKAGAAAMKKTVADLQTEKAQPVVEAAQYAVVPVDAEQKDNAECVETAEKEIKD